VARIMCDQKVGSIPVVMDQKSRKLVGMITDRDLCCSVIADGLDPKVTAIEKFMTLNPVTCRDAENVENCEQLMQEHQIRRIPVVDRAIAGIRLSDTQGEIMLGVGVNCPGEYDGLIISRLVAGIKANKPCFCRSTRRTRVQRI
jgi:CBS domain-containing protein